MIPANPTDHYRGCDFTSACLGLYINYKLTQEPPLCSIDQTPPDNCLDMMDQTQIWNCLTPVSSRPGFPHNLLWSLRSSRKYTPISLQVRPYNPSKVRGDENTTCGRCGHSTEAYRVKQASERSVTQVHPELGACYLRPLGTKHGLGLHMWVSTAPSKPISQSLH